MPAVRAVASAKTPVHAELAFRGPFNSYELTVSSNLLFLRSAHASYLHKSGVVSVAELGLATVILSNTRYFRISTRCPDLPQD